jgi:ATP-binding cassette subfamily B protein RaxB
VLANSMTVGMLIAFLAFRDQFTQRIAGLIDAVMVMRMLSLHGERISDIALAVPEGEGERVSAPARSADDTVQLSLRNVSFRYGDNEALVLRDVSMDIREGECVGIAGPSGAGKSTLLKIAAGLNEPTAGSLVFKGAPVAAMGRASYRRHVACVLQNDRLFTGSIAQNIAGFADRMDMARVEDCALLAAIHDEILSFPMGYETFVGDMGSSLSGGQTQRVIIARALYRAPKILIMDEATSHLDTDNEVRINEAIRSLKITRIIVAHRQTSLDVADRIIHLDRAHA